MSLDRFADLDAFSRRLRLGLSCASPGVSRSQGQTSPGRSVERYARGSESNSSGRFESGAGSLMAVW